MLLCATTCVTKLKPSMGIYVLQGIYNTFLQ